MNNTTIVMPVSRDSYLEQIFSRLELLSCDRTRTNIVTIVDGDNALFVKTRNLTEMSKFNERLCVQFKSKHKLRQYDILGRRMRISDIHNFAKTFIKESEYVFGIEDDTIVPTNALTKLMKDYMYEPFAGFIQGVELGRWGVPYIGAWMADDIYEPTQITSTQMKEGLHQVDAGGFYCFLTKAETYVSHDFKPFDGNSLGPDVEYGISLRQEGLLNFTNYDVKCTHKTKDRDIVAKTTQEKIVSFNKVNGRWRSGPIK